MITRHYAHILKHLLHHFPVVSILGPRQCGKTTFIRHTLPGWKYLDMERPSDAIPVSEDPEARLEQLGDEIIFDEAQRVPELFPVLRSVIDSKRPRNGLYVLLGSASPALVSHISESLAGRIAFLDMTPFRWDEIALRKDAHGLKSLWLKGGFPLAFLQKNNRARHDWLESYTRTYIESDLSALGISVSASQMRKLWTMLAYSNGAIWNASTLASSLGTSYHTVNRYTDILEQSFLIRKLPPYFVNLGKRLVKSPKVYFRDTGLLHYFLGIQASSTLDTHPSRGTSWEAFIIDQLISEYQRAASGAQPYYWRTAQGDEVDLLIDIGSRLIPYEIKLHTSPGAADTVGLQKCMRDLKLKEGYLIYPGRENYSLGNGITALSAEKLLSDPKNIIL